MKQPSRITFTAGGIFLSLLAALALVPPANTQDEDDGGPVVQKTLVFQHDGNTSGIYGLNGQGGMVEITAKNGRTILDFSLSGLTPNAVHGVWLNLDSGADPCGGSGQPACLAPFVSRSGPAAVARDEATGTQANVFGFSPAAADDAGFKAGNGLDPNAFVTDGDGNVDFTIKLNYDIFQPSAAPTVLRPGDSQTLAVTFDSPTMGTTCFASPGASYTSRIDSAYMRVYNTATVASLPAISPSYQLLDANGKPLLVRAAVRGLTIIEHFDRLTHGHVPGFHVGNPAASSCGDFENRLVGNLADAVPED